MTAYVFDIEADGLEPTKIVCLVAMDTKTGKTYEYGPDCIDKGIELLQKADKLVGHNILGYDIPVIKRLHGVDLDDGSISIVDTLVLSRLFNPTREGGHGLEGWGYRLRHRKIEYDNFEYYTPEMLAYCRQDVSLNYKVYRHLSRTEAAGFSPTSVKLEHDVYRILNAQRERGFKLNQQHAMELLAELNEKISRAEAFDKGYWTTERKTAMVKAILSGKSSTAAAANAYGVPKGRLEKWLRTAERGIANALASDTTGGPAKVRALAKAYERLKAENRELKARQSS